MSKLVIGIGNRYRSDDAIGPIVAERLGGLELTGDGAELLEVLKEASDVILIDAVRSGSPAGTVFQFDVNERSLPREMFAASTHAFGVAEAIELARTLGQLPQRLIVFGVEGSNFAAGTTLSPEVERAVPEVAERIGALDLQMK